MGLEFKKNDEGLYQVYSTIIDTKLHDTEWITEHEVKKLLITRCFWDFLENMVYIDMNFPNGYSVNYKHLPFSKAGDDEIKKLDNSGDPDRHWFLKYQELKTKYNFR